MLATEVAEVETPASVRYLAKSLQDARDYILSEHVSKKSVDQVQFFEAISALSYFLKFHLIQLLIQNAADAEVLDALQDFLETNKALDGHMTLEEAITCLELFVYLILIDPVANTGHTRLFAHTTTLLKQAEAQLHHIHTFSQTTQLVTTS